MVKGRIIAEIGENHSGDWDLAKRMIEQAARAGADIVKLQSYRGCDVAFDDPERDWFQKVAVPDQVHHELKRCAEDNGVKFLSSPFTVERARFLVEDLGLKEIKVASSELTNRPLLEYLKRRINTLYLSTGMATWKEIYEACCFIGATIPNVCLMHCVSLYPCPSHLANLAQITTLMRHAYKGEGSEFQDGNGNWQRQPITRQFVGYSDHTIGIQACITARALGATVIEKHFTLDKNQHGTDHILSCDPLDLRLMVHRIREVETLLGDDQWLKTPCAEELLHRDRIRDRWKAQHGDFIYPVMD